MIEEKSKPANTQPLRKIKPSPPKVLDQTIESNEEEMDGIEEISIEKSTNNISLFTDISFGKIISELLENEDITDISIRHGNEIWLSGLHIKNGHAKYTLDDKYSKAEIKELESLVEKIPKQLAIKMNVNFNEGTPSLDAESEYKGKGQLRFNAIHGSLTDDGKTAIAIRLNTYKLRVNKFNILNDNYITEEFLSVMKCFVDSGCNIVFMGLTGSGKTEALKYFARHIRTNEAIITIEDTLEAYLKRHYPNKDVLALKSHETFDYSYLLRDCLRQNPDWICVSEARGEEVRGLLEAVGTGHRIITTIHGDNPANLPNRMIDMAKCDGQEATRIFRQVHNTIDVCIYIHYYNDETGAHRQIAEAAEFYMDDQGKQRQHIFYKKDYATGKFIKEKIESPRIHTKLSRAKTNTREIEGVFL